MGARIAFLPALSLWAGTVAGLQWGAGDSPMVAGAVTLALVAIFRRTGVAALVIFALIGCLLGARHASSIDAQRRRIDEGSGLHRLEVRVAGPGARGGEFIEAEVFAARPPLIAGTRLRLRMPDGRRAGWNDRLRCLAEIEAGPGRRNPGGYDARAADFARGVAGRGRIHAIAHHDSTGTALWTRATVVRWRRAIERMLEERLGETARAYATPLMIGDRTGMTPEQRARIRDAGIAHLLALSGLHVTWLAWLARALVIVAGGGLGLRAMAGALSALTYLGLAGPLPALARASATEVLGAAARASQRSLDSLQALGLSIALLLAIRPGWALDLAFQLSCAATFGLTMAGVFRDGAHAPTGWGARLAAPLRATAAAQLAAGPLLVAHFHGLSWSVWIANLLAVPVAGILLALLWFAVITESLLPGAGAVLFAACEGCALALDVIARSCAALPFAYLPCGVRGAVITLASAGAILLVTDGLPVRALSDRGTAETPAARRRHVLGALLVVTSFGLALLPDALRPPAGRVWLVALDVGQGDALALGTADGWWLIDAGPRAPGYDAGEATVVPFFRWAGVRRLRGLIVTHLDADHAGGARAVWRALDPERVLCPDSGAVAMRPRRGGAFTRIAAGDTILREPLLHALWPPAGFESAARNERSAVLMLEAGGRRVLLTADADSNVEARLTVAGELALLKAGHHGARASSGAAFIAQVRPGEAWISAGRRNPFGHPHAETLARFAAADVRVRRTDLEGAIWYELSAGGIRRVDWRLSGWRQGSSGARAGPIAGPFAARSR